MEDKAELFREELDKLYTKYADTLKPQWLEYKELYMHVYNVIDKSPIVTKDDPNLINVYAVDGDTRNHIIREILQMLLQPDKMNAVRHRVQEYEQSANRIISDQKLDFTYSHDKLGEFSNLITSKITERCLIDTRVTQLMEDPYYTTLINKLIELNEDLGNTLQNSISHMKHKIIVYFNKSEDWLGRIFCDRHLVPLELQLLLRYLNKTKSI